MLHLSCCGLVDQRRAHQLFLDRSPVLKDWEPQQWEAELTNHVTW